MTTVRPPDPPGQSLASARRADRLDARHVLWRESSLPRLRACGRKIAPGNTAGVAVRVHGTGDGACAGFGGLEACGSPWSCPWCSAKIAAHRAAEIETVARTWQERGGWLAFVTLTMRHNAGQTLTDLWDAQAYAWNAAASGRGWQDDQRAHGTFTERVVQSGARAGEVVRESRIPVVRFVEVTHGANGWHVHVHALLLLSPAAGAGEQDRRRHQLHVARDLGRSMFARWKSALLRKGLDAPLREHGGLDAHPVYGDAATFSEYLTKHQYSGPRAVSLEMARGDLKSAKGGNRTPFAILRSVYETGDAADLALWHLWEQGSRGRRQIAGLPAAQRFLGLDDVELTDEQIAEQEHGGETLAHITADAWYAVVVRRRGVQARILAAAEQGDVALYRCLHDLGAGFTVPEGWSGTPRAPGRLVDRAA